MRRTPTDHVSLDDHCAVHHFIRVHGRRPSAEEVGRELQQGFDRRPATPAAAAARAKALRRQVARLVGQL